jgi:hypothetical protein
MELKNKLCFFILIAFLACASKNKSKHEVCLNFENMLLCIDGKKEINNATDGELGKIINPNYILNYEIARGAYKGPEDDIDYFRKTFNNYHHIQFFELLRLDKKVYKIYKDSVLILKVKDIPLESDQKCKNCNKEALLFFKGKEVPLRYQVTDQLRKNIAAGSSVRYIKDNLYIKIYNNEKESGMVIEKTSQNKNAKVMSIQFQEGDKIKFIEDIKAKLQLQ